MLGESLILPPPKKKRMNLRAGVLGLMLGVGVAWLPGHLPRWGPTTPGPADLKTDLHRLELEYPLADSRKPYLVLDLIASRLEYRLRGVILKTIPFQLGAVVGAGGEEALSPARLGLYSLQDRGAPVEVIQPPDPNGPLDPLDDPSVLPPDPPSTYTLSFKQPIRVHVRGVEKGSFAPAIREAARTVRGWLAHEKGGGEPGETEIEIRMESDHTQELYRALFMGEKFLVCGIGKTAE